MFVSQFNHIFLVVRKVAQQPPHLGGLPIYQLAVACKGATPAAQPLLSQATYVGDAQFAAFLRAKALNYEAAALLYSPSFTIRNARARALLLKDLVSKYYRD